MFKKSLFFFFMLFAITACKKERTIHITATNVATGERIPNLHYYIVQLTEGLNGEKATTVGEGDLDANGEANVTLKLKKTTHVIRVVPPENNCYQENISLTFGPTDFNADFKFAPCGTFQLRMKNISCFNQLDKLELKFKNSNIPEYTDFSPLPRMGCYDDEFTVSIPTGNWQAEWKVTKNGIVTEHDTTFIINESQNYYFLLEY